MLRFAISRIPVAVRPTFWITVGLLGLQNSLGGGQLFAWVVAVFLAVLLHELGHAFAARKAGADVIEVELYFLGGVTMWSSPVPLAPQRRLGVAAAGSGIGIVAGLIVLGMLRVIPLTADLEVFMRSFVFAALGWGILNWVPIRSLDGGVMVSSFFEWIAPKRGKLIAETSLFAFGVVAIVVSVVFGQWFIAAIVAFFGLSGFNALREAWKEYGDERSLGDRWHTMEDLHRAGSFEAAAQEAETIIGDANSSDWRNRAHEESVRNWYLAGSLNRAVEAGDAWHEADHHASWVAVQAYLDAGRTIDVQRLASRGVTTDPVLAGPLAVVDVMTDNTDRVNELVTSFPEPLATYLPMKVSDRIGPLDPYARRQVVALMDRLPDIPPIQKVAATIEAGWSERALEMLDAIDPNPDLQALRVHALHEVGRTSEAESLLRELATHAPTVTAQVVAIKIRLFDLAEEIGEKLIAMGGSSLHVVLYNHACVASLTGRRDDAMERTSRAIDAGFTVLRSLNFDPDIAEIRADPDFLRLRTEAWRRQQIAFGNPQPQ